MRATFDPDYAQNLIGLAKSDSITKATGKFNFLMSFIKNDDRVYSRATALTMGRNNGQQ